MSKSTASSTQQHLPIAGIQDDVIIMNDGSLRVVLKIEPINFDLKSELEQNSIIYSYQGFLNSLDFPIQIVIQSKKLDLEHYLVKLDNLKKEMSNDLLRIQTEDYVQFVRRLISVANIMSKRFYVVVSYSAITKATGLNSIFNKRPTGPIMEQEQFDRFKAEVFNRAGLVGGGLGRLGLKTSALSTQELIEVFYSTYNPDIATEQRLTDTSNLSSGIVSSFWTNPATVEEAAPLVSSEPGPVSEPTPEPDDLSSIFETQMTEESPSQPNQETQQ